MAMAVVAGAGGRTAGQSSGLAWLEQRLTAYRAEAAVPGVAVAIVRRGAVAVVTGSGSTDLDGRTPVTGDTRFRVASVTKPFTAAAVLRQVEKGTMDLDAPVRTYCPDYPPKPVDPTLRHLLAHRSGIPHTTDDEDTSIRGEVARLGESARRIANKPLAFTPGTDTLYTSWGYALLGCAIEGATRRPFWDVLVQDVLTPAGVRGAARDMPGFAAPDFTPGYRRGGLLARFRPSLVVDTRFKTPASGLIISAADLARFAIAISGDAILGPGMRAEMFRAAAADAKAGGYTLGWQLGAPRAGETVVYHTGSMEGVTAVLYLVPSARDAVVILSNRERAVADTTPLLRELALGVQR